MNVLLTKGAILSLLHSSLGQLIFDRNGASNVNVLGRGSLSKEGKISLSTYDGKKIVFNRVHSASSKDFYGEDRYGSSINLHEKLGADGINLIVGSVFDSRKNVVYQMGYNQFGKSTVRAVNATDFPPEEHIELEDSRGDVSDDKIPKQDFNVNTNRSLSNRVDIIDVMVVWTKKAECRNTYPIEGCTIIPITTNNMVAMIELAISETNTAYQLSGVKARLRLVHSYRDENYVEASSSAFLAALSHIQNPNDGIMDDVHVKRTQYGADVVAMIINDSSYSYCGMAYSNNPPVITRMFSVTKYSCATGYFTFGHEIGHNFGCNHDKGSKNACNTNAYNYGYRNPQAEFRSILAYYCKSGQCDNNVNRFCPRIQRFSNPNYKFNGKAVGSTMADNARHINEVKAIVAAFYPTVFCTSDADCDDDDICTIDTCNAEKCSNVPANPAQVAISITTDKYPWETSWKLYPYDNSSNILMSGNGYNGKGKTFTQTKDLSCGSYSFTIQDSDGDGLCCGNGKGSYNIKIKGTVVVEGGQFKFEETTQFFVDTLATYSPSKHPTPKKNFKKKTKKKVTKKTKTSKNKKG